MSRTQPSLARPRDDLIELTGYHSPQLTVSVRLNTNESPYPPPAAFVDAWLDALARVPLNRYPDRSARALRGALAGYLDQPVERVFCANGSNEVLQTLLLTYGGAGRRAAVFEPTYALHGHLARVTGTELVVGERGADHTIDPGTGTSFLTDERPALTLLCSPNNPTGTVEPAATVEALVDTSDGLVVVDEAYGEFADWSALDLVSDDRPLVVVRTYSKVWSMAALRLGFCVGPSWVIRELEKVVLPYHLAVATQLAGALALRFTAEMEARVGMLVRERERLSSELAGMEGLAVFPSGANFVLVRVGDDATAAERGHAVWQRLVDREVLVRDFSRWPRLEGSLRITVGTPEENDAVISALRGALQEET